MFVVNTTLTGGWLGGSGSNDSKAQLDAIRVTTPLQKTSNQVESLRKALQLRKSASIAKTQDSVSQSTLRSPQLQPNSLAPPSHVLDMGHGHLKPSSSAAAASASESAMDSQRDVKREHVAHGLMAPAQWMRDEDVPRCCECNSVFTMFNRRHHCRVCGRIVDSRCCSKFDINQVRVRYSDGDSQSDQRIMELVCYPCQTDIERGASTEQAACNRADANKSLRHQALRAFDSGPSHVSADVLQHDSHARRHTHGASSSANLDADDAADGSMRVESNRNGDSGVQGLQDYLMTRQRRRATVTAPSDMSLDLQLSDLRQDISGSWPAAVEPDKQAALTPLSARILRPKQGPPIKNSRFSNAPGQQLPSRAFRGGVQHHQQHSQASPPPGDLRDDVSLQDQLQTAYAKLDRTIADCDDAALASLVADHVYFDGFVGWAEMSLGLPSEVAALAADAAYQQTHGTCKQAMHNLAKKPLPGVPRSLFPMLLLNLKLELKKQDIRIHAENSLLSPTRIQKSLPSKIKSGAAAIQSERKVDAWSNGTTYSLAAEGRRSKEESHVGTAVKEIESLLQSQGFRPEECQKVAVELVSAGARDMRSIVQLLQQDNITLSKAGLQPSHLLRVLRNMAKQPAFAAEAPSFRLTLEDD